jgi:RNA polymerase sigma-70 factor (ECF subfamily)
VPEDRRMDAGCRVAEGSFEAFVLRHSAPLVQTLTFVSLDRHLAEDAAQEAFVRLYERWGTRGAPADPAAWLYRVGINQCKDFRRKLVRIGRLLERLSVDTVEASEIEPWLPQREFLDAIAVLPHRQRMAVALHYLGDLPTSEVAQVMGITEGAVHSHLHKAREALKDVLEVRT